MGAAGSDGPYGGAAVAAGYAAHRPPVHGHVVDHLVAVLGSTGSPPLGRVVDLGCGAGASTAPLLPHASSILGIDPLAAMVHAARRAVPSARFAVAGAERLPLADDTADLLVAAGSLDHVDLDRFGPEAARVLRSGGRVAAYDFFRGRRLAHTSPATGDTEEGAHGPSPPDALDRWYDRYLARSGRPPQPGDLPDRLAAVPGLALERLDRFAVAVPLTRSAYLEYVLTDAADPGDLELRAWCEATLPEAFGAEETVGFDAYLALLAPT